MSREQLRQRAIALFVSDSMGLANEASFDLIAEEERERFFEMARTEMKTEAA